MVKHKGNILFMWIKTRVIGGNSSARRVDHRCKRLVSYVSYSVKPTLLLHCPICKHRHSCYTILCYPFFM